jgi:SAM-dependent methyltransferase
MRIESARWQADAWDASADRVDTEVMSHLQRIGARAVELLPITTGASVIDCACGSGHASLAAAERAGPGGRVIGIDISGRLLALARAKAAARGLDNVELRLGDMQQLALGAGQFDAVLCLFALFFVPDMAAQLRRFWSHLRPGGRLGIAIWAPEALEPARGQAWLPSLRRERPDLVAQSAARDRVGAGDQLRSIFAEAEIAEVELVTCHEEQRLETPESWWELLHALAQPRWSIEQLTPEQLARVKQANIAWIREQHLDRVNVNWIFARAIKPVPRRP